MSNAIDVGTPHPEFVNWEVFTFRFHGFDTLATPTGHYISSPSFTCFGSEWKVRLHPNGMGWDGGWGGSGIGLYLELLSGAMLCKDFRYNARILDAEGKRILGDKSKEFFWGNDCCGWINFKTREEIIDPSSEILYHGTLTIELRMKRTEENKNFIPKNPFNSTMSKLFGDEESADVVFEVGGSNERDKPPSTTRFHAHKVILKACAPDLAALCEECDKSMPVPIPNVEPGIFGKLLRYVYGKDIPTTEWKEHAKDFIDAADRYGVVTLKLEAEVWYLKYCEVTIQNVVEVLLYADAKHCALLKEAAMKFVVKNYDEVLELDSFERMPKHKSIMKELGTVFAMNGAGNAGSGRGTKTMSIDSLRMMLHEKGQDIDGSREMLIKRLDE